MSTRLVIFAAITLAGALILTACGGERVGDVPVGGAAGQPPEKATNTPWEHLASPTSTPVKTNAWDPPPPTNTPAPGATSVSATATLPPAAQPTATQPAAQPTATNTLVPPTAAYQLPACYVAGQDKCNCPNFTTHAQAQWFHDNYDPTDINGLDGNPKNGIVCESLP